MNDTIFLIQSDGSLTELSSTSYDSEDLLQGLLAHYPRLLHQVDGGRPLLLVKREAGIPEGDGSGNRWSLDHLFVDRSGVPTLVEVKRSSDTRIRREVVGQMLDYAANAIAYWPVERLRMDFERTQEAAEQDPDEALREFLGPEASADEFWLSVKTNLKAGKIRLVFVADAIPTELRRIIEFLNEQMDPAEVLGVELRQYEGASVRSLVPVLVGSTAEAEQKKTVSRKRTWDRSSYLQWLRDDARTAEIQIVERILEWGDTNRLSLRWGSGSTEASVYLEYRVGESTQPLFAVRSGTHTYVQLQLPYMKAPFDGAAERATLVEKVKAATGSAITPDAKFPGIVLSDPTEKRLSGLLEVFEHVIEATRAAHE